MTKILKRVTLVLLSAVLILGMYGCRLATSTQEVTAEDVAESISDITSDEDGNVIINLIDGRTFTLGNLKGEKGDKGDKGDPGTNGTNGVNGTNGKDGLNGVNGKDGKDAEIIDENEGKHKVSITYNISYNADYTGPDLNFDETYYYEAGEEVVIDIPYKIYLDDERNETRFVIRDSEEYELPDGFIILGTYGLDNYEALTSAGDYRIRGTMPDSDVDIQFNLQQLVKITINNVITNYNNYNINTETIFSQPYTSDDIWFIDDLAEKTSGWTVIDDNVFIYELKKGITGLSPQVDSICTREYNIIGSTEPYSDFIQWPTNAERHSAIYNQLINITDQEEYCNLIKEYLNSLGFNNIKFNVLSFDNTNGYMNDYRIRLDSMFTETETDYSLKKYLVQGYYYSPDTELIVTVEKD